MSRIRGCLAAAAVVGLLCCAAACGSRYEEEPKEKTQLQLWHYWDLGGARQALKEAVDQYNLSQDEVSVEIKYIPDEDFKKELALNLADGTAPDLAVVDSSDLKFFHKMKPFAELDSVIEPEAYLSYTLAPAEVNGKIYGAPMGVNCLAFYYNTDILQEAGVSPPQTLEDFLVAAKELTKGGQYGCAFPTLQSEETVFCLLPLFWSQEVSLADIDSSEGKEVFVFIRRLMEEGILSEEMMGMTLGDIAREFRKGRIAMMFTTTMSAVDIRRENPDLNFEMAKLPLGSKPVSVIGGEILTVTEGKNSEAAIEFVRYMMEMEKNTEYLNKMGYLSARKDVMQKQISESPQNRNIAEILETARVREFSSEWPKISIAFSEAVEEIVQGADIDAAAEELKDEIEKIRGGSR